jgi:hypothetical protein
MDKMSLLIAFIQENAFVWILLLSKWFPTVDVVLFFWLSMSRPTNSVLLLLGPNDLLLSYVIFFLWVGHVWDVNLRKSKLIVVVN